MAGWRVVMRGLRAAAARRGPGRPARSRSSTPSPTRSAGRTSPDGGELYLVTNDGAIEFRLVKAPVTPPGADGWREVIAASADTRLVACDAFRPELGAGAHAGPAGRYDQLRYEAEILAFILNEAGLPQSG